jgi:hypothetical protein
MVLFTVVVYDVSAIGRLQTTVVLLNEIRWSIDNEKSKEQNSKMLLYWCAIHSRRMTNVYVINYGYLGAGTHIDNDTPRKRHLLLKLVGRMAIDRSSTNFNP